MLNPNPYLLLGLPETAHSKHILSILFTKILFIVRTMTLMGLLVSLALPYAQAQSVLNVAGNTLLNSSLIVEYSVGELAIATIQNTITQGVLQPSLQSPYVITDTDDAFTAQYGFRAYPNPTTESINVETSYTDFNAYQILDLSGKVIQIHPFDYTTIPLSTLSSGMYLVKLLSKNNTLTKTFKLIKP